MEPSNWLDALFLILQTLVVLFLLLHDRIPLGRLNNLAAIRSVDGLPRRIFVTLLPVIPTAFGLVWSARRFGQPHPMGLEILLWITYGTLLVGILRAWWIPYLVTPDAQRAERYQTMFSGTHAFLPRRNGIVPDTLHSVFHLTTLATMLVMVVREHRY